MTTKYKKTPADTSCFSVLLWMSGKVKPEQVRNQIPFPQSWNVEIAKEPLNGRVFDLYITDSETFCQNRQYLKELKRNTAPVMLPVLILAEDTDSLEQLDRPWEVADDMLSLSESASILKARLRLLARNRFLSKELKCKNDRLRDKNNKLEKEKTRYELLTEQSTDMVVVNRPDGTFTYVSPSSVKLTGYTPDELRGTCLHDYIHPEDLEQAMETHREFMKIRDIHTVTFRFKTKDGTYKWMESKVKTIRDDQSGEVREVQSALRDISERKKYEQKLKAEKEFINTAVDNMPGIFYMLDEEQNFVFWNRNLEKQFGYSEEELSRMVSYDFFKEKDHLLVQKKVKEVLETGKGEFEADLIKNNGETVPYFLIGSRLKRDGNTFIVGSGIDISEQREAKYKSEQQEKLLSAIINQTDALITVKDAEGEILMANRKYLEVFNLDFDEVIGKTDLEIHDRSFAEKVRKNDQKVLETKTPMEFEEIAQTGNSIRHFLSMKYPLEDVPGFENCFCTISTEITERKNVLSQLQERIKEQSCLYNIARLNGRPDTVEELLEEAVTYLPDGWQYPDITEAKIEYGDKKFITEGYRDSNWALVNDSKKVEGKSLSVKVVYLEEKPPYDEGPFIREERKLIDAITDTLASQIQRILSQRKLKESEKRWEELVQNDPNLIQITTPEGVIKFINQSGAKKLFGVDNPEELIGKNYFSLIKVDEPEIAKARIKKVLDGEKVEPHTYKITTKDGRIRYMSVQAMMTTLENGEKGLQQVAQDVTDRVRYEKELKKSLKEKEVLLQEIHHRVKNNLAVISGLLSIQRFESNNETVNRMLSDSEMRIKTMALIHEKLYQSQSLSEIDLGYYIQDLAETIKTTMKPREEIMLNFNADSVLLNVNQAVPCGLILNELITNALNHAFTEQKRGEIIVRVKEEYDKVNITVSDNGKGLPADFKSESHGSMGFTIIDTLVKQLRGEIDIQSRKGTSVQLSFSKRNVKGSSSTMV